MSWLPTLLLTAGLSLAIAYLLLIRFYLKGWASLPVWEVPAGWTPRTSVSVIVPARNEAENILPCVRSLLNQSYPAELLEVIVVDDHSEDAALERLSGLSHPSLRVLSLTAEDGEGKKAALRRGIRSARGALILTTDADCIVPTNWLSLMVSYFEKHRPVFLAGPVGFHSEQTAFERFQSLDYLGMMVLTGGGIARRFTHLSNGANLAFSKAAFEAVGGYRGIDHLASGDDLLLMHKLARRYPGRIAFLKNPDAMVLTRPKGSWRAFLRQRLRWATKTSHYQDRRILPVTGLVFLLCMSIPLALLLTPWLGWPFLLLFFLLLGGKSLADHQLLSAATRFFGRPELMRDFWPAQGWHVVYILAVGGLSWVRRSYEWKGRWVR